MAVPPPEKLVVVAEAAIQSWLRPSDLQLAKALRTICHPFLVNITKICLRHEMGYHPQCTGFWPNTSFKSGIIIIIISIIILKFINMISKLIIIIIEKYCSLYLRGKLLYGISCLSLLLLLLLLLHIIFIIKTFYSVLVSTGSS
jgi:hypothetical protein